jgi:SAM-dependent methyltransferase
MRAEVCYIEINRALWDARTPYHVASATYDQDGFLKGRTSLTEIELDVLGDLAGKSLLHLQCHFGQDTLSLARMGARVTGIDFSGEAIAKAAEFAHQLGIDARFICTDIYELPAHLDQQFDLVFTSYGVLGWLPDMQRWAQIVARHLKPGGRFVLVEFHPMVFMLNNALTQIEYSYFNREPIIEISTGTYADRAAPIENKEIGWNHPISEVLQNLLEAGLTLSSFAEFDYSPFGCFENMIETAAGQFQVRGLEGKLPLVYRVVAEKVDLHCAAAPATTYKTAG